MDKRGVLQAKGARTILTSPFVTGYNLRYSVCLWAECFFDTHTCMHNTYTHTNTHMHASTHAYACTYAHTWA